MVRKPSPRMCGYSLPAAATLRAPPDDARSDKWSLGLAANYLSECETTLGNPPAVTMEKCPCQGNIFGPSPRCPAIDEVSSTLSLPWRDRFVSLPPPQNRIFIFWLSQLGLGWASRMVSESRHWICDSSCPRGPPWILMVRKPSVGMSGGNRVPNSVIQACREATGSEKSCSALAANDLRR